MPRDRRSEKCVLVMCDYYASPVWSGDGEASIELESLPLTEVTRRALRAWADWYDRLGTEEWSAHDDQAFDEEGERLWRLVAHELADDYRVGYFSERTGQRHWDPPAM